MTRSLVPLLLLSVMGCLELSLPQAPPPPGPGTLQGTLTHAVAGRTSLVPAKSARVDLLESSNTVLADDDGRFLLAGLTQTQGLVRMTLDLDGDGAPDRQRVFSLKALGAGPGRDVAMGEVVLGRNARLTGKVLRGDLAGDAFHLGTTVFITGMEFSTFSADTGAWTLDGLPEGPLQVSFFRQGYLPDSREVTLAAGAELRLSDVSLRASPSEASTVSGVVLDVTGAPVPQATVRAVSPDGAATATTRDDGAFSLGPVPSGAWVMGVERTGFVSASLGRRLLLPGANELGVIVLAPGTSVPLPLDAGAVPPRPDGGGVDGGNVMDAGATDAGPDAGLGDGGVRCGGLCAPGFVCDADESCRATACGQQSCALCNGGQCFSTACPPGQDCRPGDVCSAQACVPLACAGVTCAANTACANGQCLPTACGTTACRSGFVCLTTGQCVEARCVGRVCGAGQLCSDGTCYPTGVPGSPCAPGFAFIQGRCREVACEGVSCAAGTQCSRGQCLSGGLFVAGLLRPRNAPGQGTANRYALAGTVGGKWVKLASFVDPIVALDINADGTWLFLRTVSLGNPPTTALYRSQDGRAWTQVWSGTQATTGVLTDLHIDDVSGTLTASIVGFQSNGLHRLMTSTDNGNTWALRWQAPPSLGVRSFAPPNFFAVENPTLLIPEGLARIEEPPLPDGGTYTRLFTAAGAADPRLISDRRGVGPTLLSHDVGFTYFLDGGLSGSFSTVPGGDLYAAPPSRQVFLLTPTNVARSFDGARTWSFRSPAVSSPNFTGLVRGADDALYLANENSNPPLSVSTDDGETWTTVPTTWATVGGLAAYWPEWEPNTQHLTSIVVQPTEARTTGFVYRLSTSGTTGATEPDWADAGAVVVDGTARWVIDSVPPEMRPTAMVSRACTPGLQRCGAGCVDVTTSAQHCGGCNQPCGSTCLAGRCLSSGVVDGGASVGCADGTREGFGDPTRFPDLAACAGSWMQDLDVSTSADALCASGWHVCDQNDTEVRAVNHQDATAFPGCFAFRASIDGLDGCGPLDCSNDVSHDDVAAVGATCLAISGVSRGPSQVPDGGACFSDRGVIASQCCSVSVATPSRPAGCPQRGESGVVCCR